MYGLNDFLKIYDTNIHREGSEKLRNWLLASDFQIAPASTKFHGNYPGGLVEHSVNVYYEFQRLLEAYKDRIYCSNETAAIITLLHDVCKINFYVQEMRNKKIDGKWEQVPIYTIDEKFCFAGYHGPKSVYLIQNFMKLTPEEAVAIAGHMGNENGDYGPYRSYERMPVAWMLHAADEASSIFEVADASEDAANT